MLQYQRIVVSTQANVGQPGALPPARVGLSDASLANLPAALNPQAVTLLGLADTGFLPVVTADVPQTVTRLQFVTALQNAGSYTAVASAINALPVGDPVRLYFLNTAIFTRTDPRLLAFAASMGQSAAQVDAVFTAASLITP
jgi:hypothetical protein